MASVSVSGSTFSNSFPKLLTAWAAFYVLRISFNSLNMWKAFKKLLFIILFLVIFSYPSVQNRFQRSRKECAQTSLTESEWNQFNHFYCDRAQKKDYVNIKPFVTNTLGFNAFVLSSLLYLYDVYFCKSSYEMLSVLVYLRRASHDVCSFQINRLDRRSR